MKLIKIRYSQKKSIKKENNILKQNAKKNSKKG